MKEAIASMDAEFTTSCESLDKLLVSMKQTGAGFDFENAKQQLKTHSQKFSRLDGPYKRVQKCSGQLQSIMGKKLQSPGSGKKLKLSVTTAGAPQVMPSGGVHLAAAAVVHAQVSASEAPLNFNCAAALVDAGPGQAALHRGSDFLEKLLKEKAYQECSKFVQDTIKKSEAKAVEEEEDEEKDGVEEGRGGGGGGGGGRRRRRRRRCIYMCASLRALSSPSALPSWVLGPPERGAAGPPGGGGAHGGPPLHGGRGWVSGEMTEGKRG
eukprot:9496143-Pyramimonas_sp.AAC.1